ncbi:hypothetical protein R5R35_010531 [Gryllus longicercus]|uniref:C3H1-type domain-containing protein n=1 Tax=Gryllus longicercus TaxID=2509291 RepID=A0AAN9Z183_9ORTH
MSTPTEIRNEIDEEPEEGEIQDDEGSLEDVSSDEEIAPLAKRRERTCTLVTVRGQFVKTEKKQLIRSPRREMRLCPERSDVNLKKCQSRVKSGCRTAGVPDSYYESVLRHKSLKEHSQKGKMHEKENKAKESKKGRRRSISFHGSGSDLRNTYIGPDHAESYFSSTSSKVPWHKGDLKDKHKKKKKSSKTNKVSNPLGEVSASQRKTSREYCNLIDCVQTGENAKEELIQTMPEKKPEAEEMPELTSPSSPSSDIQILEVPVIVPEIITICDSDDEVMKSGNGNCNVNPSCTQEEDNICNIQLPPDPRPSPPKEIVEESCEDPDDNLKLLREAALNSSKSDPCVSVIRDDEVLQLRLAALRSAIIRKCEERKKKGITLTKTNKNVGDKQVMSISPLGSPNCSDEIDRDLSSPFEFNMLSNHDMPEPANDSEVDKITTIDMELADSDEEKEQECTESGYHNCEVSEVKLNNNNSTSFVADGRPLEPHRDDESNIIYSVESVASVVPQDCPPATHFTTVCTTDSPTGYIIGDQELEQSPFEVEIPSISEQPLDSMSKPQSDIGESGNLLGLNNGNQSPSSDQILEVSNCEHVHDKIHETVAECCLTEEVSRKSFQPSESSEIVALVSVDSRNNEALDMISSRSDCSFLSPVSRELDLDSMIVLDEVGKSSDEARSESSIEDVSSSGKLANSLYDEKENICGSINVADLFEENSDVNICNFSNSRSSSENVPIFSDNFETTQEMFEKDINVHLYSATSSECPANEISQNNSKNFEICGSTLSTCGEVSDFSLQIAISNSQGSNELLPQANINKDLQLEECAKGYTEITSELSNLSSNLLNDTETRDKEVCSESVGITGNTDNSQNFSKFSSVEGKGFLDLLEADCCKSLLKPVLSSASEEKSVDSSNVRDLVHEPGDPVIDSSSVDQLQQTDHMFLTDTLKSGEKSNNQESITEDDETVLRDSLLAMLKKRTKEQNIKHTSETDVPINNENGNSVPENNQTAKNIFPISLEKKSCNEKGESNGLNKNDSKSDDSLLKQASVSCSLNVSPSLVKTLPKKQLFPIRNPTSLNKRGAKSNKIRRREAKVPGQLTPLFNVNVPKLVIHLGEDSDSNEDENECIAVPSNSNGSDASEEAKDKSSGSQSVPPDFEKKLDLLLKQARFQQETSTKDDQDNSSENPNSPATSMNKIITLSSTSSNADAEKTSKSISSSNGSSNTHLLTSSKVSPLIVHGVNNQRDKNININTVSKDKTVLSGNIVNVTRTSVGRAVDVNKKDIHGRIKYTSAVANSSSSVSSVVDIGLLPSSKQKEYIRLKRQLAQLARREQEVKAKENVKVTNAIRLPVSKDGTEENKIFTNQDVRNTIIKNTAGIGSERSPFTRKFVRRGQGGTIITRADFGKSRRIVRSITTTYGSHTLSRNRLTVTTPNRVGISSVDGSSIVRRVLCVPQKRIVSTLTNVKKVPPGFQNVAPRVSPSDTQSDLANIVRKSSEEHVNATDGPLLQVGIVRTINNKQEKQSSESSVQGSSKVIRKYNVKSALKRKGSTSDINGVLRKKPASEHPSSREENESESSLENTHLKDNSMSESNECTRRLSGIVQIGENTPLSKRKRCNSELSDVPVQRIPIDQESTEQHAISSVQCNCQDSTKTVLPERTLADGLWDSESKLISKRYQVLEDIASVQMNLHEIEKVTELRQQIVRDIKRLQNEMNFAKAQLCKKEELLKVLYSEVEIAKRDIMRRQSETLLLSVECEEMGGKVHGSNYSVPNTCTDLIRKGMAAISKTLQEMEDQKLATNSEHEIPAPSPTGETVLKESNTVQETTNEIPEAEEMPNINIEDSNKQNSGSYLSPLDAMRTTTEPNNDNQAVLCPYHIMGSCKDKECSYLH